MRSSNVLPFRSSKPTGESWGPRIVAAVFYLYLVTLASSVTGGLSVLLILVLLYALFIHRQIHRTAYFRKNRVLLLIVLAVGVLFFMRGKAILLALMTALYWALVYRPLGDAPYFLRFHMLTGLTLNGLLLLFFILLDAVVEFLLSWGPLLRLSGMSTISALYHQYFYMGTALIFLLAAVYLATMALMGRTPYIRFVTSNVRHWA